ncbi:MAG: hypothetical protein KC983_09855, partial [Phycisphaerales bacterium]|nr:hypothetical protein [Phycisphaerales bacterium]
SAASHAQPAMRMESERNIINMTNELKRRKRTTDKSGAGVAACGSRQRKDTDSTRIGRNPAAASPKSVSVP